MLKITVPGVEVFDNAAQEFKTQGDFVLELEHSLVSLSKWESKYEKPFLSKETKSDEEVIGYIQAMTLTEDVPQDVFGKLSQDNLNAINEYLDSKMTATRIYELHEAPKTKQETVTAELIYYWMVSFQIPFECQHWHLNRLFTLIRLCSVKAEKPKKMSKGEIARRNRELNAQRRAQLGTKG